MMLRYLIQLFYLTCIPCLAFGQITGTFTADNSYAVYVGNQNSVVTKVLPNSTANGHTNSTASQIFSPTQNTFNASAFDYLYIIAWSDDKSCQGLIGEFSGNSTIRTGDSGWEVYPTNQNYGNGQAPSLAVVNQFINTANAFNGWQSPFVGPRNIDGNTACTAYRKVNGVSDDAKWIWYNDTNSNDPKDVLGKGRNHKEFLIFRFPVYQISNNAEIDECDCIPEESYDLDITGSIFEMRNVIGSLSNFTYNLKFSPHNQYAALSNTWNTWINTLFGLSNSQACQVVHQYMLYEYTSSPTGGIATETLLEQFWSVPNYLGNASNKFTTTLNSNTKYYIKHGVYYEKKVGGGPCLLSKECPWKDTWLFFETFAGKQPAIKLLDNKGNFKKLLSPSSESKRFKK